MIKDAIKKIIGIVLVYAAFVGWTITVCFADCMEALQLFAAIVGCGIALLGGVAMRGGTE